MAKIRISSLVTSDLCNVAEYLMTIISSEFRHKSFNKQIFHITLEPINSLSDPKKNRLLSLSK
jgi:hypothetical protein